MTQEYRTTAFQMHRAANANAVGTMARSHVPIEKTVMYETAAADFGKHQVDKAAALLAARHRETAHNRTHGFSKEFDGVNRPVRFVAPDLPRGSPESRRMRQRQRQEMQSERQAVRSTVSATARMEAARAAHEAAPQQRPQNSGSYNDGGSRHVSAAEVLAATRQKNRQFELDRDVAALHALVYRYDTR